MKKLLLILLALPCLLTAQTSYDKTQDKKNVLQDSSIAQMRRDIATLYSQNASYKQQLVDMQGALNTVKVGIKALQSQDSVFQKAQDADHDIAVDAFIEANKKDTTVFSGGLVATPVSLTKTVVSLLALPDISMLTKTAAKASTDVIDLSAKLAATQADIVTLKALYLKLKAQYP